MGKLQRLDIEFEHPQAVFMAGERVIGHVILHLNEAMKMRRLRVWIQGRAKVHWSKTRRSNGHNHTTHYRAEEIYFEESVLLFGSDDGNQETHPAGYHTYSFSLTLPPACPSSFEGTYGYVRYTSVATIDRPWKFDHEAKVAFTVISILDLNTETTNLRAPVEEAETKENTCCCCVSGNVEAKFSINKTGFVPGENILVNAAITNNSNSDVDSTAVAIKQYITFYGRSGSFLSSGDLRPKMCTEVVAEMRHTLIKPGDTDYYTNSPLRVPPLPPSRLVGCNIIDILYVVKFYVNTWDSIKFENEITIGTVPFRESFFPSPYGAITTQPQPSAPPGAPPPPPDGNFELPPPSYEECVQGQREIREEGDSEYLMGKLSWAPSYPTYNMLNPPATNPDNASPSNTAPMATMTPGVGFSGVSGSEPSAHVQDNRV